MRYCDASRLRNSPIDDETVISPAFVDTTEIASGAQAGIDASAISNTTIV
jgi:hypothetical protein